MKQIVNSDARLKFLCKLLFNSLGYSCHYEVQLRTHSYIDLYKTHDISDIDVLGFRFNSDLSFTKVGSECKSGEKGALEEVFKLIGVRDYFGLDKAYFIKTKIHQNAREVASRHKIRCFSESELRLLLTSIEGDVDRNLSIEQAKYLKKTNFLLNYRKKNQKLIDYVRFDYWNKDNWRNIHNLIFLLGNFEALSLFPKVDIGDKFVHYHIVELLGVAILRNIDLAIDLNYSDINKSLINQLFGGTESLHERRKLFDLINREHQENASFEPVWQYDLVHISSRFASSPKEAAKIPELIIAIYENSFYQDKINISTDQIVLFPDKTRKFVQDLMQFVIKHCQVKEEVFEEFMTM